MHLTSCHVPAAERQFLLGVAVSPTCPELLMAPTNKRLLCLIISDLVISAFQTVRPQIVRIAGFRQQALAALRSRPPQGGPDSGIDGSRTQAGKSVISRFQPVGPQTWGHKSC